VLAPYWTDQCTAEAGFGCACNGCGIFTATEGTAPNRVFYVEFRTRYYTNQALLDYEIALYENGAPPFRYVYGTVTPATTPNDSLLVVGTKRDDSFFTQYGCDPTGGQNPPVTSGQQLTATAVGCGTPTPTATASPTCTPGDVIVNGGFETGSFPPWVIDGHTNDPIVATNFAHSGTHSAFAGGNPQQNTYCEENNNEPLGDSSFYQQFTVPAGGGTLSFWHKDCTNDSIAFDWQDAYITDSNGNILQTIYHLCDNADWTNVQVDMTPHAGMTVRIKFLVHQDGFNPPGDTTGMWVDDVSLPRQCGTQTSVDKGPVSYNARQQGNHAYLKRMTNLKRNLQLLRRGLGSTATNRNKTAEISLQ